MPDYSLFEHAMKLESKGNYLEAFNIFEFLLDSSEHDKGDLLFHCGWCLENSVPVKFLRALAYYKKAAQTTTIPLCRMNSFFRCGWLLMQSKQYQYADESFRKAICSDALRQFVFVQRLIACWCTL